MSDFNENDEIFYFLSSVWNITKAQELIKAGAGTEKTINVKEAAENLGLLVIDKEHAETVDLTKPLIGIIHETEKYLLIIDGWHRIYKAYTKNIKTLSCIVLDVADSKKVKVR